MAWLLRGVNLPLSAAAAVLILWSLVSSDPYSLRLLTTAGVFAIAVLGYQFIFGYAGALSLAQGTFFGIGAYTTGIIGSQLGWGFEATFALSLAFPVLLAILVAAPVLRLDSHYFALATLGIGQVVLLIAINWESVTGGANGIPGVPGISVFAIDVSRGWPLLMFVWGLAILAATIAWLAIRGITGHAFALMRSDPLAAMAVGIDIRRLRFKAFLISALLAGAAGALHVHTNRVISPDALEFHIMVAILAMTVVGGRTHIAGAFVGALLLTHLAEWFRFLEHYYLLAYGILLLLMVVAAPWGLVGTAERLRERLLPERAPPPPQPSPIRLAAKPVSGLEIRGLRKRFGGVRALDGIDLEVQPGEILGVFGPNGCGKTTLINIVTGLEAADEGEIRWAGKPIDGVTTDASARAGITRTFQKTRLLEDLTALDNVAVGRWEGGKGPRVGVARQQAMGLLNELDATDAAMIPARNLPQGVRRRVEIARALAARPSLLLLDEPATGLNEGERQALAETIERIAQQGLTLVVVDHDLAFLSEFAHRMVCLDHGTIVAAGTLEEVQHHPAVKSVFLGGPSSAKGARELND